MRKPHPISTTKPQATDGEVLPNSLCVLCVFVQGYTTVVHAVITNNLLCPLRDEELHKSRGDRNRRSPARGLAKRVIDIDE